MIKLKSVEMALVFVLGFLVACQPADPFHSGARGSGSSGGRGAEKVQGQSVEATSAALSDYAHYLVSRLNEAKNLAEMGLRLASSRADEPSELLSACEQVHALSSHQWRLASPYCRLRGLMPLGGGRAIVDGSHYFEIFAGDSASEGLGAQEFPLNSLKSLKVVAQDLAIEMELEQTEQFSALADLRESRELRLVHTDSLESGLEAFFLHYRVNMHSLRQTLRHEGLQETAYENGSQYIQIKGTLVVDDFGRAVRFAVESMNLRTYAPREIRRRGQSPRTRYNEVNLGLLQSSSHNPLVFTGACSAPQGKLRVVGARQVSGGDGKRLSGEWAIQSEELCPHVQTKAPQSWHGAYWLVFLR